MHTISSENCLGNGNHRTALEHQNSRIQPTCSTDNVEATLLIILCSDTDIFVPALH